MSKNRYYMETEAVKKSEAMATAKPQPCWNRSSEAERRQVLESRNRPME